MVKATNPNTGLKVTLPGLVKRRALESELWLRPENDAPFLASPHMPHKVYTDETRQPGDGAQGSAPARGARTGLFDVLQVVPHGTRVFVVREKGWAAVDLQGDGVIDGWMSLDFLASAQG